MSDDFIPLNQSTPIGGRWQGKQQRFQQHNNSSRRMNGSRRGSNRWPNDSRFSSGASDSNTSYSMSQDRNNIDAYLHPSMLQDPWAQLRNKQQDSSSSTEHSYPSRCASSRRIEAFNRLTLSRIKLKESANQQPQST